MRLNVVSHFGFFHPAGALAHHAQRVLGEMRRPMAPPLSVVVEVAILAHCTIGKLLKISHRTSAHECEAPA